MRKVSFILCLLLIIGWYSSAQIPLSIRGVVGDSAGVGIPSATVLLLSERDSLRVITSENGRFKLTLSKSKPFELQVTTKGFVPYKQRYVPDSAISFLELEPIKLQYQYNELDTIIVAKVRPVIIGQDTVTYEASAFTVRDGAELEALLKRLPGLEVDQEGNVVAQGKRIIKVMVDGKLFFGGDVLTATRNLPASIIKSLQVIDDYGDKSRLTGIKSGESTKVLNITLKEGKRSGTFGQSQVGMGNLGKYISNTFANYFRGPTQLGINAGISNSNPSGYDRQTHFDMNYNDNWNKHLKVETNTTFLMSDTRTKNSMEQDNYYDKGQTHLEQSTADSSNTNEGKMYLIATYTPDSYKTLRISPGLSIQSSHQSSSSPFITIQQDSETTIATNGNTLNSSQGKGYSFGTQIYYEQISRHSNNRFSIDLSTEFTDGIQVSDAKVNTVVQKNSYITNSLQHYVTKYKNPAQNLQADINYFLPLSKAGFLEFGYALHRQINRSYNSTFKKDNIIGSDIPIDSLSQSFRYQTYNHIIHIGYSGHIKQINIGSWIELQPGNLQGNIIEKGDDVKYSYLSWQPTLQATYSISQGHTFSFQYNGRPQLPGLRQIQPVPNLSNPQYPVIGNPSLKPAYAQSLNLRYEQATLKSQNPCEFGVGVGYNITNHTILSSITYPKDTSGIIQKTEYINAGDTYSFNANYHITFPPFLRKRLKIMANGNFSNSHNISSIDKMVYGIITNSGSQGIHVLYLIPNVVDFDLSGNYTITQSSYAYSENSPILTSFAKWAVSDRHYFGQKFTLSYQVSQLLTNTSGKRLQASPTNLSASIQFQLLHNKGTLDITGYNLLNVENAPGLVVSQNSVTKTQMDLVKRFVIASLFIKLSGFRK